MTTNRVSTRTVYEVLRLGNVESHEADGGVKVAIK